MIIYAAVRDIDGEDLPSPMSVRPTKEDVQEYCDWIKKMTPEWDALYPVVRITRFQCKEI
jgi:hypothetical protein